jgi:23S rRNA (adenine2503-C2)-methyltransferase
MRALSEFDPQVLAQHLEENGFKPSHARKLLRAYFLASGEPPLESLELGRSLLDHLSAEIPLVSSRVIRDVTARDGTHKLLVGLHDGNRVESVLMPAYRADRAAACVSSQVGCAMGCDFCASTRSGMQRNLTSGEMVEQFLHLQRVAQTHNRRISSLVFMGMGEPMHNLENVLPAIDRIATPGLGGRGWRNITVSTVGVISGIDQLARAGRRVALAVSLHAPDDQTRAAIVPSARRWKVADIVAAAQAYSARTRTITTIEYCLLAEVNDSDEQAHQLAQLLHDFEAHVNLIPYNWIGTGLSGRIYRKPTIERMEAFAGILSSRGVVTHFRRTRGDDVNAACGQLRETTLVEPGAIA